MSKQLSQFHAAPASDSASPTAMSPDGMPTERILAPTIYCQSERVAQCVDRIALRERAR